MTPDETDDHGPLRASLAEAARVPAMVEAHLPVIARVSALLAETLRRGDKLLACGNGGSAADAQHLTGEWVGRFVGDRRSYPAVALSADGPLLTAIANDYGYDEAFARQVRGLGAPGDLLVALSTSGNSESIVRALAAAREGGLTTVTLLGRDGGRARGAADHEIVIDSPVTARIQEAHGLIVHLLCEETERLLTHPPAPSLGGRGRGRGRGQSTPPTGYSYLPLPPREGAGGWVSPPARTAAWPRTSFRRCP